TVVVRGNAADNFQVTTIDWRLSPSTQLNHANGTTAWTINNLTLTASNQTLTVICTDAAGNTASALLSFTLLAPAFLQPSPVVMATALADSPVNGAWFVRPAPIQTIATLPIPHMVGPTTQAVQPVPITMPMPVQLENVDHPRPQSLTQSVSNPGWF